MAKIARKRAVTKVVTMTTDRLLDCGDDYTGTKNAWKTRIWKLLSYRFLLAM